MRAAQSHSQYVNQQKLRRYFDKVTAAYVEFREYSPLVACNYDPTGCSKKLHPAVIHFLSDVDIATKQVLRKPKLIKQWITLIQGAELKPAIAALIINRCSRIYIARHLAPY